MTKRRWGLVIAVMGLAGCGGRAPVGVHERESPAVQARPDARAEVSQQRSRPGVPGFPGLFLNDRIYGGTSSWTADGYPPAGDWFAPRPKPTAPGI